MQQAVSQATNPYSSFSYYAIEEIAIDNWNSFSKLLVLHTKGLNFRTTPYAKELKLKIEQKLKELAYDDWNESDALQEMYDHLLNNQTNFSRTLRLEIEERMKDLESFHWVSTNAPIGPGVLDTSKWKKENFLSLLGYKSGSYGIDDDSRKTILDGAYTMPIPKNLLPFIEDVTEWGNPGKGIRLKKIADSIASVVRSEKRNTSKDYCLSIEEREADLAYLKEEYYDGNYDFPWART